MTDEAQVTAAVARRRRASRASTCSIDTAGRGLIGAVEEASEDEIRSLFAINVFGLLSVTLAVLPIMRGQGSGRILNISSVGGFTARSGGGIYAGTKFAVEGLSEALRAGLEPLGIQVTIVEPGSFRTDFLDPARWCSPPARARTTRGPPATSAAEPTSSTTSSRMIRGKQPRRSSPSPRPRSVRCASSSGPDAVVVVLPAFASSRGKLRAARVRTSSDRCGLRRA